MEPHVFEEKVRRLARCIWPDAAFSGRTVLDGREQDMYIETPDAIIFMDATVSKRPDTIRDKIKKFKDLFRSNRGRFGKPSVAYIVTAAEPDQYQIQALKDAKTDNILLLSFSALENRLIDATKYLMLRPRAPFGSVRGLLENVNSADVPREQFVQPKFATVRATKDTTFSRIASDISRSSAGARYLIAGYFGMGKSMTLRALFDYCKTEFERDRTESIPIHLNLGDHQGQTKPHEALIRHADNIGFGPSHQLVAAWRAGRTILLLDGFDELTTSGWGWELAKKRAHRKQAMTLVRKLIEESPRETSIVLSGRWTYFDVSTEMYDALGVDDTFSHYDLEDFDEDQLTAYLRKLGKNVVVPDWVPPRPLLVGYLAANNLLPEADAESGITPAAGWNALIAMSAKREERQDLRLDRGAVRLILERLATAARNTRDGLGRLSEQTIQDTFTDVTGGSPDQASLNVLFRLPFLRPTPDFDGFRSFVERDCADALRAGELVHFLGAPFSNDSVKFVARSSDSCASSQLTAEVVVARMDDSVLTPKQIALAANRARDLGSVQIAGELVIVAALSDQGRPDREVSISGANYLDIDLSQLSEDSSNVIFHECIFESLVVDPANEGNAPRFQNCLIGTMGGIARFEEMPAVFFGCGAEQWESHYSTTDKILDGAQQPEMRVLQTVIRKLFFQRGSARQENAFYKGLDTRHRELVEPIINRLISHKFCYWGPTKRGRVLVPIR